MYVSMGGMMGLPLPDLLAGRQNGFVCAVLQLLLSIPPLLINRIFFTRGFKALWMRAPNMHNPVNYKRGFHTEIPPLITASSYPSVPQVQ